VRKKGNKVQGINVLSNIFGINLLSLQVSEAMRSKAEAEQRSELLAAQNQDLLKENMRLKYA
jgi:hypothetical protein